MKFLLQNQVHHDQNGIALLTQLYAATKDCFFDVIEIDMQLTTWFDADMCAALGAILYLLGVELNSVRLINVSPNVEKVLSKNGFLIHYGGEPMSDLWDTTVSYRRFDIKDDQYFSIYIEREFMDRDEMPSMSVGLKKEFRKSVLEIFSNAGLHSETKWGVFSCGQFFPNRSQLAFSVADLGIGIPERVRRYLNSDIQPEEAIDWATRDFHTTKSTNIPGGLGLKLLREFIDQNDGCFQIVSDAGYWSRKNRETTVTRLDHPFPGTVVNIQINTADQKSYALTSEFTSGSIF